MTRNDTLFGQSELALDQLELVHSALLPLYDHEPVPPATKRKALPLLARHAHLVSLPPPTQATKLELASTVLLVQLTAFSALLKATAASVARDRLSGLDILRDSLASDGNPLVWRRRFDGKQGRIDSQLANLFATLFRTFASKADGQPNVSARTLFLLRLFGIECLLQTPFDGDSAARKVDALVEQSRRALLLYSRHATDTAHLASDSTRLFRTVADKLAFSHASALALLADAVLQIARKVCERLRFVS